MGIQAEVYNEPQIDMNISYSMIGEYVSSKKGIIELFFTSIILDDIELFHQTMNPIMLSRDLMKLPNPNKIEATIPFMKTISRNYRLNKIQFSEDCETGNIANKLHVKLIYTDGYEVIIPIEVKKYSGSYKNYVINSSMLDIATMIE